MSEPHDVRRPPSRPRGRRVALAVVLVVAALGVAPEASTRCPSPTSLDERYLTPVFSCVEVERDLVYGRAASDDEALHLDLYRPVPDAERPRPTLVLVHGGGHATGDKSDLDGAATHYARLGYVVASVNYTLDEGLRGADTTDPGQLEKVAAAFRDGVRDTQQAIAYLQRRADSFGIARDRIGIVGWSAGGSISLGHVLSGTDDGSAPGRPESDVAAVVAASGFLAGPPLSQIAEHPAPALLIGYEADTANAPPIAPVCRSLREASGSCTVRVLPGEGHAIDFVELGPVVVPFLAEHLT